MTDTPIWMPFNVADYIKDTRHLTAAERGAYVELLCHAWLNGGAIANDAKRVFRLSGLSAREWALSRVTLLEFFTLVDGVYRHKRVDQELEKAWKLIEQKRAAGKASGRARSERVLNGCSTSVATADPTADERQGNQLQSQSSFTNVKGAGAPEDIGKLVFDEGVALLVGNGSAEGAARSFIGKCRKAVGDERFLGLIRECTERNISEPRAWLAASLKNPANDQEAGLSAAIADLAKRKAAQEAA